MSEAKPEWVFDPVPPSGSLTGGDPTSYVFSPDIDTLVREVVQNATDQQSGDEPVHVKFTLHELPDDMRGELLDAVDLASRLGYGCQSLKHCATSSRENVGFPPITAARYRATTAESRAGAEPT